MSARAQGGSDELLEASWSDRGRTVCGRELRLELAMTGTFAAAVGALLALGAPLGSVDPVVLLVVLAYAVTARVEFPIGSGHVVPTQLFLVPLFAVAPAALVPALVYAGLALGLLGEVLLGRARPDRFAYCGGDAMHALGPAIVLTALAGGDVMQAPPEALLLAFIAQLGSDFASSSLHDLLVFGTRPRLHARVLVHVWGVDAALAPLGLLAASHASAWGVLAPLPLVALLKAMSIDRSRRIDQAHERLNALNVERRRRDEAVRRVGDALASRLGLDPLLELVGRAATEALDGADGRARAAHGVPPSDLLGAVEVDALRAGGAAIAERDGLHAIAAPIGEPPGPIGVISVARATPFSAEERSLLEYLCGQAAVSAENVVGHERLRAAEERLRHQAFHDGLTELANRALFHDRVTHALARVARAPQPLAVLFLDLDGFKLVNDTLGHAAGDELLVVTAGRIRGCLRDSDTAARLGGDEFGILLEDLHGRAEAELVAERLRVALRAPVVLRGREFVVRASIGMALAAGDGGPDALLRRADLAMYAAKSEGGDRVELFRPEMLAQADTRTELATDLREAIARRQLELRFQPIVELTDARVCAVEALTRWQHARRGLLAAESFIPLAEQTGVIAELGRFVLDEACRAAAGWSGVDGGEAPRVTVNVSPAQLRQARFAQDVAAALARHVLPARRLVLEITESVATDSDGETQATLAALRALGVGLALDDFGTGHSSLSCLSRTAVDMLKLDRTFVADIEHDPVQARLVASVIQLADALGLAVVAEGVERREQVDRLLELGGRLGQGFLFGEPMTADELARWLGRPVSVAM